MVDNKIASARQLANQAAKQLHVNTEILRKADERFQILEEHLVKMEHEVHALVVAMCLPC